MAASRVSAEVWCARCTMLSASISKVKATAHRAPFGHGTGLAIIGCPPLAAQQTPEVLALPLFRLLVMQETSLLTAKFWGMHRPVPVQILTRNELVQHLMEDDVFDDVVGHKGLVQEAVDANQPIALLVGTKAYGPALALWRPATPGNVRLHTIDKVVLIDLIINRFKVKIAPLWLQQTGTLRRCLEAGQQGLLLPYIRPYGTRG